MWMGHGNRKTGEGKYYDFTARSGKRIGFKIDERFLKTARRVAVKITHFDRKPGSMTLQYRGGKRSVELTGDGNVRTATFFIRDFNNSKPHATGYDLVIEGRPEAVVAFVRVVRTR